MAAELGRMPGCLQYQELVVHLCSSSETEETPWDKSEASIAFPGIRLRRVSVGPITRSFPLHLHGALPSLFVPGAYPGSFLKVLSVFSSTASCGRSAYSLQLGL